MWHKKLWSNGIFRYSNKIKAFTDHISVIMGRWKNKLPGWKAQKLGFSCSLLKGDLKLLKFLLEFLARKATVKWLQNVVLQKKQDDQTVLEVAKSQTEMSPKDDNRKEIFEILSLKNQVLEKECKEVWKKLQMQS